MTKQIALSLLVLMAVATAQWGVPPSVAHAKAADSAGKAANSYKLQGQDTAALRALYDSVDYAIWAESAKTVQGWDTTDIKAAAGSGTDSATVSSLINDTATALRGEMIDSGAVAASDTAAALRGEMLDTLTAWQPGYDTGYTPQAKFQVYDNMRLSGTGNLLRNNYVTSIDATYASADNAADYDSIPTYDGSGEVIHASVYYDPIGWPDTSGYKWWMLMSPYPGMDPAYENPSIVASKNGSDWVEPAGITNPIESAPVGNWNCDPELVCGPDGKLYAFWATDSTRTLAVRRSSDGVNWGAKETSLVTTGTDHVTSPAIIRDGDHYSLWYSTNPGGGRVLRRRTAPTLLGPWSDYTTCTINNKNAGAVLWHQGVFRDGETYVLLWIDNGTPLSMWMATSTDGDTWNAKATPILAPSGSGWDSVALYRPYGMVTEHNGKKQYLVYYVGKNAADEWHVGHTRINVGALCDLDSAVAIDTSAVTGSEKLYVAGNIKASDSLISSHVGTSSAGFDSMAATYYYSPLVYDSCVNQAATINWSAGNVHHVHVDTGDITLTLTNPKSGGRYVIITKGPDSVYCRSITFDPVPLWADSGAVPPIDTTPDAVNVFTFIYNGILTKYLGASGKAFQ